MSSRERLANLREKIVNDLHQLRQAGERRQAMEKVDAITGRIVGDNNRVRMNRFLSSLDAETDAASIEAIRKYVRSRLNPRLKSAGLKEIT